MLVTASMWGSGFFSTARREACILASSFGPLHVAFAHMTDGTGQEPAGAASRIEQRLTRFRVDHPRHERGHGARRVVFARVAGRLQVVQDLLVDVAEVPARSQVVEIDAVDLVNDLPHQLAGLHVVVGIPEHGAQDVRARAGPRRELLQLRKEIAVDEVEQLLARDAFRVGGPVPPTQMDRDRRAVAVLEKFELLVLVVDDLEEEHPAQLADTLRIAIDACVLAHDVLNGFDEGTDRHLLSDLLVESELKIVHGPLEIGLPAEGAD